MRLNQFLARHSDLSRRGADRAIEEGRVMVNAAPASIGQHVTDTDVVSLDGAALSREISVTTIMLNKPVGYVCSRTGQGSKTVYELLPRELHNLKPVGRLDKDSTGLLLMTNDGELANRLTHPRYQKTKVYEITVDKSLTLDDFKHLKQGVVLEDGISKLGVQELPTGHSQLDNARQIPDSQLLITMSEGRNRQIRRTFAALGYNVISLHRTAFGTYRLNGVALGSWAHVTHNST